ncbi:M14 family metallopeptidase [Flagellimonas myxillae]|uniref:M14 family metallopeptidase n=1 Tax=Flagellimonas myxillae TaxID=2942214 RepID=UPI00201EF8A6|nr:M14 family metallopeptidase [Muricauda myxillae]MCL6266297.1 M14 family metallopeptidase [Muricauda myxillae]
MKKRILLSRKKGLLFVVGAALVFMAGCTVKKVKSEKSVDTTDKQIVYQTKKTYEFKDIGVWVSNEFDGARLNGAYQLNDSTITLQFYPENTPINKSPYYAFQTWSEVPNKVYFAFTYPEGFDHRYKPKRKINGEWTVIDSLDLIHTENGPLLKLELQKEPQTIAAQEINSSKDVGDWIRQEIVKDRDFVRLGSAGVSKMGKNLPVLDIHHGDAEGKPIIVLMTRQHPPEVTGFFAFQHFLKAIVDQSELSTQFLNSYRVLAFPILNPDGVDLGHWRHNANGIDLNRDWSKYRQPEIKNAVTYITKASKKDKGGIVLGLDFHSTYEDVFYTNVKREGTTLPNFIDDWFEILERDIKGYMVNEAAANSTMPVSKGWFLYGQNATGITYEIGDHTPRDRIAEIGATSAKAMMQVLLKE